jgi:Hydrazine synthase alpha subunit middle domain/WD40-like Beta Propeller Repeat
MFHIKMQLGDTWGPTRRRLALGTFALLTLAGCRGSAPNDVFDDGVTTESLVFVKTTGEETLNRSWANSNLYRLSPISPEGRVTPITNYTGASVSDPCVSFEGTRILFSMRPPGGRDRNIYEIGVDGRNMRQITSGGGHDFDPLYLADGRILFTSSRAGEMDEYNHSPAEHLHRCNADGTGLERLSFNQSDDFDPMLMGNGQVVYTRWEHFGTFNRFPLFVMNPDGTGIFPRYGPHNRNFFHPQATPDGRIIAIESTRVNEDAGPIALLRLENGPADPVLGSTSDYWSVLTDNVNNDGAPWTYGAFKYPFPIGDNRYVASYTLPAGSEEDTDYALYTFSLIESGSGTPEDPTRFEIGDLTFLYNDPSTNDYDAQLIAARAKPPVIADTIDRDLDYGVFIAQDIFNRSPSDGQEVPVRGTDSVSKIAVIAARPTRVGEANTISANRFEKRAFIGYAPVQPDGSFSIKVPADTPITFATLDSQDRGFVVKRTWLAVRPGEVFDQCTGCHEDRVADQPAPTNPNPMSRALPPTDLNIPESQFQIITWENNIGNIVERKCVSCHQPGDTDLPQVDTPIYNGSNFPMPAGGLDLTNVPVELMMENQTFPRGYVNLSGESEEMTRQVVRPAFPRRSVLIDWVLGVGSQAGQPPHPEGADALTPTEREQLNLWVLLGAQYR